MSENRVLLGYRNMVGIPFASCPCGDCGYYMALERVEGLQCKFVSWCGNTLRCTFESEDELRAFVARNGGS